MFLKKNTGKKDKIQPSGQTKKIDRKIGIRHKRLLI